MSNEPKQTAVEQFAIALYDGGYLRGNGDEIETLLNTFKAMEKQQIKETARTYFHECSTLTPEQYYTETFGGNGLLEK
jgi:hypothetical protein